MFNKNKKAEETSETQGNSQDNSGQGVNFTIQRVYVKDMSFESPLSPKIFASQDWKPEVNIELSVKHDKLDTHVYEVVLFVNVTLTHEKKTVFINELKQSGIFSIEGIDGEQLDHLLGSYCPNILFPYAREAISDVVARGGFPQLLLAPVNFDALYEQSKKQAANS